MKGTLEYKGYTGSIEYSPDDRCFFGKIEFINDLIMFDGTSVDALEESFHDAVDSYLEFCKSQEKEPNQPFKGSFNVRVSEDLHRRSSVEAKKAGITLNEFVKVSLEEKLSNRPIIHKHEHFHIPERKFEASYDFDADLENSFHVTVPAGSMTNTVQ